MEKLTDEQIVKALEQCSTTICCKGCPCRPLCYTDVNALEKASLDLINRQKAEIEQWKEQNVRLNKECDHYIRYASEAIKEFAEKVYRVLCNRQNWMAFKDAWLEDGECHWLKMKLDNLLKVMLGEVNDFKE
jgi:hypothetical protein